jgi:hypothetical protein
MPYNPQFACVTGVVDAAYTLLRERFHYQPGLACPVGEKRSLIGCRPDFIRNPWRREPHGGTVEIKGSRFAASVLVETLCGPCRRSATLQTVDARPVTDRLSFRRLAA